MPERMLGSKSPAWSVWKLNMSGLLRPGGGIAYNATMFAERNFDNG